MADVMFPPTRHGYEADVPAMAPVRASLARNLAPEKAISVPAAPCVVHFVSCASSATLRRMEGQN